MTHEDPGKRAVFNDLRFRQAMSVAINRVEINQTAFFELGEPKQYVGFSPTPPFVEDKWKQYYAQHDPKLANQLLDQAGLKDTDGDGFREMPNGQKLVVNLQFSVQGAPAALVELVGQHWAAVGIQTTVKEVTPDEFRSAQSANQLDVTMWRKGEPLPIILGSNEMWVPPYHDYFQLRTNMLWAEYLETKGAKGVKPPDYAYQMIDDITAFQSIPVGSAESDQLGARLVKNMVENLLFIGTVQVPAPIYHRNELQNIVEYKTHSFEYYRSYPYRPTQWWLDE